MFDFDGDGSSEYADQCFMRIYKGTTESHVPRSSTTRWEYPVIVDADGDGHTEIVTLERLHATLGCPAVDPLTRTTSPPSLPLI